MRQFLILLAALGAGMFGLWLATIATVLIAGARPVVRPADAIIVMGAAQYNGRPSPVLKARLDHALDLWNRGLARRLILTGGIGTGDTLSEGEVARRYAVDTGVPDSVILVEGTGQTSAESMKEAASLMHANGLHSALIVSDSYHMLRLELLARRAGIRPFRSPAPSSPIDRDRATHRRYVLRESVLLPAQAIIDGR